MPRTKKRLHEPRITFTADDAAKLYELAAENLVKVDGCEQCDNIKTRLIKFIGFQRAADINVMLEANPYCEPKVVEKEVEVEVEKIVEVEKPRSGWASVFVIVLLIATVFGTIVFSAHDCSVIDRGYQFSFASEETPVINACKK